MSLGAVWLFIGVYDLSGPKTTSEFWEELKDIRGSWEEPWIIGSDFNVIRFVNEKSSG